jgi:hypothetical protein
MREFESGSHLIIISCGLKNIEKKNEITGYIELARNLLQLLVDHLTFWSMLFKSSII